MFFVLHRINKAQPTTWSSPTTLQIGLGENIIELEDLTSVQQRIVASLYSGILAGQEAIIDQSVGAEPGETASLVEKLGPLLQKEDKPKFGPWQEIAFAEIARAGLDYNVNGEMVLAERWQSAVHIDQLDKAGMLVAKALLASGVGKILSHDNGLVLKTDLGELGYPKYALGETRFSAARKLLSEFSMPNVTDRLIDLSVRPDPKTKVSLALTIGHLALNPRSYSRWLSRDVSHLSIIFELNHALVSPLVIPGETSCLNCMQEAKVDEEENWPVIATQLLGLPRVRDDAAALLSACGLACRSILRRLDEQAGFEYVRDDLHQSLLGYRIDYATGNIQRLRYEKHLLCSCREISQNIEQSD
ncbi:MAG: hypothetical protein RL523_381 [Actinomycetota bacterium]|jgi:hypothetical protein